MTPTPRLVRLIEPLIGPDFRDAITGDLVERFELDLSRRGAIVAHLRLWRECFMALRHFGRLSTNQRVNPVRSFVADVRFGLRVLRRTPSFAIVCIITLALAIGPTAAILSVVDPLLFRPLPYGRPERLAFVWERGGNGSPITTGYTTIEDLRARATTLASVAAVGSWQTTLSTQENPERLQGARVSWNYFRTLAVPMMLGRDFTREEDAQNKNTVVILSHTLWERRFNADSSIVGRTIPLNETPRTVVGILPADYDDVINPAAQIFMPLGYVATLPWACRTCRHLTAVVRVRDGVSFERATAELNQISSQLVSAFPKEYPAVGFFLNPLQQDVMRDARPALLAILGAVALVLLIAVANVVNLHLAQSIRRETEFAVRAALGASGGRLIQQLVAEGLSVALAGVAAGLLLARAILPALVSRLPANLPRRTVIHLEGSVVLTLAVVAVLIALVIGLVPAIVARRRSLYSSEMRSAARQSAGHTRARAALVVGEIALALLLLCGAGLLSLSLTKLFDVDRGFDGNNVITLRFQASGPRYPDNAAILAARRRVLATAAAVPGVVDVSSITLLPLNGGLDRYGIMAQDKPLDHPERAPAATGYRVVGDYLKTMRIRILSGRDLTEADARDTSANPVVISASLARALWPGENPINKRIQLSNSRRRWSTVIGVAADVRQRSLNDDDGRAFYYPEDHWLFALTEGVLVARVNGNPEAVLRAVRAAVAGVDPSQPVVDVRTMDDVVSRSTAQRQLALLLFVSFAGLAVLLAAAGVYGVLAGSVSERTKEIGVRTALGATTIDTYALVLRRGLGMAAVGLLLGLVGAVATTRYLQALLFGVAPTDPTVLLVSAVLLFAVAFIACLIPARRAVHIEPMVALRQ
ncbi:MAG TPA: ABC transporter permease [Gemmatimonadaceae bacterium]|nr:ABC transporter permease [Gemmatimonadaceae bacterium]